MRIIHRILGTNIVLSKMKMTPSDLCTFGCQEKETIEHLFWLCNHATLFWQQLEDRIHDKCAHAAQFNFSMALVLLGHVSGFNSDDICDFIVLLGKYFIYKCRCEKKVPTCTGFMNYLKARYVIEKHVAMSSLHYDTFREK